MKYRNDYELGYSHGKNGMESKYPNNFNYKRGFSAGENALMREIMATKPDDDFLPAGTSDAFKDQFHC